MMSLLAALLCGAMFGTGCTWHRQTNPATGKTRVIWRPASCEWQNGGLVIDPDEMPTGMVVAPIEDFGKVHRFNEPRDPVITIAE